MTRSFPYGGDVRHPSSRQPVNQALNTQEIRGDYQTVIVPKGSPLSQRPGQAQAEAGGMDGTICFGDGRRSLTVIIFWCENNLNSVASEKDKYR